jgi:hypothetical protein
VANAGNACVALLERLFDHAPLFPPASLPLDEAIREDERARSSGSSFALGRLVWPASQVRKAPPDRPLSVVLDVPLELGAHVEAVEVPPGIAFDLPADTEAYVELRLDDGLDRSLDDIADRAVRAKVRCGGAAIPSSRDLARFLRGCRERGIVYKATAGLHHAVRTNGEHGFLNLLAAAVFGDEEEALTESDPGAFTLDEASFAWRRRTAGPHELARARREGLHSIGSCSFFEPVEELEALGILPL